MSSRPTDEVEPAIPGFEILEEIGRGSTGRVYRARQIALKREVAIKVIAAGGASGERRALRLFREARMTGALDHPGIVHAIDAGESEGICWFAMELVSGRDLERILDDLDGPLPPAEVIRIGLEALDALEHAHRNGVIHRDIKPANLLLERGGKLRLLDLGLARRRFDPRLTQEGGCVGTPQYMAPEQANSPERVGVASDLFSLGGTLYRALTGRPPFAGRRVAEVLAELLYTDPTPADELVSDLPPGLSAVLQRALQKEPQRRFKDAGHFARALRAVADGRWTGDEIAGEAKASRRRRGVLVASGVGALALVTALLWQPWKRGDEAAPSETNPTPPAQVTAPVGKSEDLRALDRLVAETASLRDPALLWSRLLSGREHLSRLGPRERARGAVALKVLEERWVGARKDRLRAARADAETGLLSGDLQPFEIARAELEATRRRLEAEDELRARLSAALAREEERIRLARTQASVRARKEAMARMAALAADPKSLDVSPGAIRARLHEAWSELPGIALLLLGDDRRAVVDREKSLADRLSDDPLLTLQAALKEARELIAQRRYLSARRLLSDAERAAASVPGGEKRRAFAVASLEEAAKEELGVARGLLELLARGSEAREPLQRAELEHRVRRLHDGINGLPDRAELPELVPLAGALDRLNLILKELHGLEPRLRGVLEKRGPEDGPLRFQKALRGGGKLGLHHFESIGLDGRLRLSRVGDQVRSEHALEELGAASIAELAAALGVELSPLAIALRAYYDGDDLLAEELLEEAPRGMLRDALGGRVEAALASRAEAAYPGSTEDQAAYRIWLRALHHEGRAQPERARSALEEVELRRTRARSFWKDHGKEARRRRQALQSRSDALSMLGPWKQHLAARDDARGVYRFRIAKGAAGVDRVLRLPRALSVPDAEGLARLESARLHPGGTPVEIPPLELDLPRMPYRRMLLRVGLDWSADEAPGFLWFTLAEACFLGIDGLRDGSPFRGRPLNGLQRRVWSVRKIEKAGLWSGELAEYPEALQQEAVHFTLAGGKERELVIEARRLKGTAGVTELSVTVGNSKAKKRMSRLQGHRFALAGFPSYALREVELELWL